MMTVADMIVKLEKFAPPQTAASWDNVGLLLGDRSTKVAKALTCLTLTREVADEAVANGAQLIVTHHPILFRSAKRITDDTVEGETILKLARARLAVYSPHTAFDDCPGGINDQLARILNLSNIRPLRVAGTEECKLVVFVPDTDLARVSDAMFAAGAGNIGQYRECSFRLKGTGTFFGGDSTNPTLGQKGQREQVEEWRLEVVCERRRVDAVVAAMRAVHSYEEPAFDVYSLVPMTRKIGSGRIGSLSHPQPLVELAAQLRSQLKCGPVQVVGDPHRPITTVAVACGAAGEFLNDAVKAGADAFVTGEMRFHDYLAAKAANIGLILPGHYATERFAVEWLSTWLQSQFPGLSVMPSQSESDPANWV